MGRLSETLISNRIYTHGVCRAGLGFSYFWCAQPLLIEVGLISGQPPKMGVFLEVGLNRF